MPELGTVAALHRYPVKSMLGEPLDAVEVTANGFVGDRTLALLDTETGRVASAKHPKTWRALLTMRSRWNDGAPQITLPDDSTVAATEDAGPVLSALLERPVRVIASRPDGATVARPDPEAVLAAGETAEVPFELLELGQATPGANFVDYAPVHVVSTSTLAHVGVEAARYRPNLVLDTPGGTPFAENAWVGRELTVGSIRLRVLVPTPRCAIPTLAHGELPRRPEAVKRLLRENRTDVPGFGVLPCLGAYAEVIDGGSLRLHERVTLS